MMKKRRQHYVWRYYLKAWALKDKVWCCRDGKIFSSNLMGVGQERDFYKIKDLTIHDVEFIDEFVIGQTYKELREINRGWIDLFGLVKKYRAVIEMNGWGSQKIIDELEIQEHNLEENYHGKIEEGAIESISELSNRKFNFLKSDFNRMNFLNYLCTQYLRTKKIQESVINNFAPLYEGTPINIPSCWPIMRHIFATNMAASLFANKDRFRFTLLINDTSIPFITGDQPVINICAHEALQESVQNLELYYPITPDTAIIIADTGRYNSKDRIYIDEVSVEEFNEYVIKFSHEQIYANSKNLIERYCKNTTTTI